MSAKHLRKRGFTLVEILIVVVILGILAAIVIPQFTNASQSAQASSLISQLQTLRSQLELYQVQHSGDYPTLVTDTNWDKLTKVTNQDEEVYADAAAAQAAGETSWYGPYLQQPSRNPFEDSTTVAAAAAEGVGWVYDEATGSIYAVMEAAKAAAVFGDKVPAEMAAGTDPDIVTY